MPEGDPSVFTRVLYGCESDEVAEIVILTPLDDVIEALRRCSQGARDLSGFCQGFRARLDGADISVFNSRVGSPMASDCAYFLRFTPCKNIIYTGLIGGLQPHIRVGDLIVPTAACRGEGASKYFVDEAYPAVADYKLLWTLSSTLDEVYEGCDVNIYYGPIYTTDSFAAETDEFLERWRSMKVLGIEMETSAIYTVASVYGMRAAAVHVVSDNPVAEKSFFHRFEEPDKNRRKLCEGLLIKALVKLVAAI
jgi:uridine phosphorylase